MSVLSKPTLKLFSCEKTEIEVITRIKKETSRNIFSGESELYKFSN